MAQPMAQPADIRSQHPLWDERDAVGRRAMLTEILAQVSHEALQGDTLEAVLHAIVDCITRRLPVTIASIILLNEERTHFVQEVWSGRVELELPGGMPWPVEMGAAGRCARTGERQLITDSRNDPDYVPGNHDVSSEYLVPIRHQGRMHGVLNLESTRADFFTPEVCTVFDAIAEQIAGAIHVARLLRELEAANRKLRDLSMRDGLTGIANRRCFDARMAEEWRRHANDGASLALLMVDVDCFKALNDRSGHLQGDECLRELAQLCAAHVRDGSDLAARYGGEEIVILLPRCGLAEALRVAETLRGHVEELALPHPDSPAGDCVTVSIGVGAACPRDAGASPDALVAAADAAMYAAKARGRNCVQAQAPAA
ncbi:MAG TPA: diguanylate cyclase [Rhodanobacteraceae bacterium]|jgi:diguanylate cyclase (GGDEF)-like protein|nr:diguanylate cyclase [Rhodanobacteraceae bacterium]